MLRIFSGGVGIWVLYRFRITMSTACKKIRRVGEKSFSEIRMAIDKDERISYNESKKAHVRKKRGRL